MRLVVISGCDVILTTLEDANEVRYFEHILHRVLSEGGFGGDDLTYVGFLGDCWRMCSVRRVKWASVLDQDAAAASVSSRGK